MQLQLSVGVTFSLTLEKAMVGDLGKSLWLKEIFSSVYGEKRPLCHIGILKQNEKPTQYICQFCFRILDKP